MRWLLPILLVGTLAAQVFGAVNGPPKKPYDERADYELSKHLWLISQSPHQYEILFPRAVDGVMAGSPVGCGAFVQGWQPNRSVVIENFGQTDVHEPRLALNGKRSWRTVERCNTQCRGPDGHYLIAKGQLA